MCAMLAVLCALTTIALSPSEVYEEKFLVCSMSEILFDDFIAVKVVCIRKVDATIAIRYASSYLKHVHRSSYDKVVAIVAGDGKNVDLQFDENWVIGFDE